MDMRTPEPVRNREQPVVTQEKVRRRRSSPSLVILLCLLLLGVGAAAGYMWRDQNAKDSAKTKQAEITALQAKNTKLEKDLAEAKKESSASTASKRPNQAALDNIKAAIVSGNTAALAGYMASTVRVIIAASEGVGDRTPTQAINDLEYIDNATDPWNFDLPAATLTEYQTGDYKQYFPTTAYVGKSANNYVISFQFDNAGKINGIFMTNSASLL
jgi:cell division protein FtsB